MAGVSSIQGGSSGATESILRAAADNTAVAALLLKKATDADKNLVNTLLPVNPPAGSVNIAA